MQGFAYTKGSALQDKLAFPKEENNYFYVIN
jgi:hypothetical protein